MSIFWRATTFSIKFEHNLHTSRYVKHDLLSMSVSSPLMKFPNSFLKTKNIWLFLIYFLSMRICVACICHWKISCTCFGSYLCVCRIVANWNKVLMFELVFSFEFSFFFKVLSFRFWITSIFTMDFSQIHISFLFS